MQQSQTRHTISLVEDEPAAIGLARHIVVLPDLKLPKLDAWRSMIFLSCQLVCWLTSNHSRLDFATP